MSNLLPRHAQVIVEINRLFVKSDIAHSFPSSPLLFFSFLFFFFFFFLFTILDYSFSSFMERVTRTNPHIPAGDLTIVEDGQGDQHVNMAVSE